MGSGKWFSLYFIYSAAQHSPEMKYFRSARRPTADTNIQSIPFAKAAIFYIEGQTSAWTPNACTIQNDRPTDRANGSLPIRSRHCIVSGIRSTFFFSLFLLHVHLRSLPFIHWGFFLLLLLLRIFVLLCERSALPHIFWICWWCAFALVATVVFLSPHIFIFPSFHARTSSASSASLRPSLFLLLCRFASVFYI